MTETINITVNDIVETVLLTVNETTEEIAIAVTETVEQVEITVSDNVTLLIPLEFEQRVSDLETEVDELGENTSFQNETPGHIPIVDSSGGDWEFVNPFEVFNSVSTSPFIQLKDVVLGNLITVTMPTNRSTVIGLIQQIDESDGNKVYTPSFTTANDGKSAIFTSMLTQLQNKIRIWPVES